MNKAPTRKSHVRLENENECKAYNAPGISELQATPYASIREYID